MAQLEPSSDDLTTEQRQQRCEWARRMWADSSNSLEWTLVMHCVAAARRRHWTSTSVISGFKNPEMHPEFIDAVFEEFLACKLTGGTA